MIRTRRQICPSLALPCTIVLMTLSGCGSTVISQEFRRVPDSVVESALVATDADFSRYDRLTAADMGIFFPTNTQVPEDDLQQIRTIFRGAFIEALDGYTVVDEPGEGVMLVNASLIDLRTAHYEDIPNLQREVRDIARPGTLVFLIELADSQTGRVLGRAADSSLNPEIGSDAIEGAEWDAVAGAATHWAYLFRQFLDENLAD